MAVGESTLCEALILLEVIDDETGEVDAQKMGFKGASCSLLL